jgi:rubrerythrin
MPSRYDGMPSFALKLGARKSIRRGCHVVPTPRMLIGRKAGGDAAMARQHSMKNLSDLSEQERVALAIALEEEDERIYDEFADGLRETYPASAQVFRDMAAEESSHRHRLIELHREKFGEHVREGRSGSRADDRR